MSTTQFRVDVWAWIDRAKENKEVVIRTGLVETAKRLIDRSPVGDPTLWKHPPSRFYQPGTFKANWQYGNSQLGVPSEALDFQDPSGGDTLAAIVGKIPEKVTGLVHTFVNNVPYARRIEMGWSTQAPTGVVALTVLELPSIMEAALAKVQQ